MKTGSIPVRATNSLLLNRINDFVRIGVLKNALLLTLEPFQKCCRRVAPAAISPSPLIPLPLGEGNDSRALLVAGKPASRTQAHDMG